eukprot:SAG22_NODE_1217_length_5138_cov_6.636039_3_plen_114_part_00
MNLNLNNSSALHQAREELSTLTQRVLTLLLDLRSNEKEFKLLVRKVRAGLMAGAGQLLAAPPAAIEVRTRVCRCCCRHCCQCEDGKLTVTELVQTYAEYIREQASTNLLESER